MLCWVLRERACADCGSPHLPLTCPDLQDARAWPNYASDYRPLVEFAKTRSMPVVAANAPRRHVAAAARGGAAALAVLPPASQALLPPQPLPPPSRALADKARGRGGGYPLAPPDP